MNFLLIGLEHAPRICRIIYDVTWIMINSLVNNLYLYHYYQWHNFSLIVIGIIMSYLDNASTDSMIQNTTLGVILK